MKRVFLLLLLGGCLASAQEPSVKAEPAKPKTQPSITAEQLKGRLIELQRGKEQAMANVNAFLGAIQEVQHWLDELKAAEPSPKTEKAAEQHADK